MNLQPAMPMTQQEYEVLLLITNHVAAWNRRPPVLAQITVHRVEGLGQLGDVCLDGIAFGPAPRRSA